MCFQLLLSLLQGRLDEKVSTSRFPGSSVPSGSDLSSFQKCLGSAFFARRGGWKPSCCLCWSEQGRWFDRVVRNYWGGASKRELECHDSVLGNQKQEQEGADATIQSNLSTFYAFFLIIVILSIIFHHPLRYWQQGKGDLWKIGVYSVFNNRFQDNLRVSSECYHSPANQIIGKAETSEQWWDYGRFLVARPYKALIPRPTPPLPQWSANCKMDARHKLISCKSSSP